MTTNFHTVLREKYNGGADTFPTLSYDEIAKMIDATVPRGTVFKPHQSRINRFSGGSLAFKNSKFADGDPDAIYTCSTNYRFNGTGDKMPETMLKKDRKNQVNHYIRQLAQGGDFIIVDDKYNRAKYRPRHFDNWAKEDYDAITGGDMKTGIETLKRKKVKLIPTATQYRLNANFLGDNPGPEELEKAKNMNNLMGNFNEQQLEALRIAEAIARIKEKAPEIKEVSLTEPEKDKMFFEQYPPSIPYGPVSGSGSRRMVPVGRHLMRKNLSGKGVNKWLKPLGAFVAPPKAPSYLAPDLGKILPFLKMLGMGHQRYGGSRQRYGGSLRRYGGGIGGAAISGIFKALAKGGAMAAKNAVKMVPRLLKRAPGLLIKRLGRLGPRLAKNSMKKIPQLLKRFIPTLTKKGIPRMAKKLLGKAVKKGITAGITMGVERGVERAIPPAKKEGSGRQKFNLKKIIGETERYIKRRVHNNMYKNLDQARGRQYHRRHKHGGIFDGEGKKRKRMRRRGTKRMRYQPPPPFEFDPARDPRMGRGRRRFGGRLPNRYGGAISFGRMYRKSQNLKPIAMKTIKSVQPLVTSIKKAVKPLDLFQKKPISNQGISTLGTQASSAINQGLATLTTGNKKTLKRTLNKVKDLGVTKAKQAFKKKANQVFKKGSQKILNKLTNGKKGLFGKFKDLGLSGLKSLTSGKKGKKKKGKKRRSKKA